MPGSQISVLVIAAPADHAHCVVSPYASASASNISVICLGCRVAGLSWVAAYSA